MPDIPEIKLLSSYQVPNPEYPKVIKRGRRLFLEVKPRDGQGYEVPEDPIKVLGLLHHLAGKTWADPNFFFFAIARIAEKRGWEIHPCQG